MFLSFLSLIVLYFVHVTSWSFCFLGKKKMILLLYCSLLLTCLNFSYCYSYFMLSGTLASITGLWFKWICLVLKAFWVLCVPFKTPWNVLSIFSVYDMFKLLIKHVTSIKFFIFMLIITFFLVIRSTLHFLLRLLYVINLSCT